MSMKMFSAGENCIFSATTYHNEFKNGEQIVIESRRSNTKHDYPDTLYRAYSEREGADKLRYVFRRNLERIKSPRIPAVSIDELLKVV